MSAGKPPGVGMWDDERARPWRSALVLLVWLALVYAAGEVWPWGFAQ